MATTSHSARRVVWASLVIALGGLLFGYDTGVISGALPAMASYFKLTPFTSGVVVSSLVVGAAIGALSSGRLSDKHGRRPMLLFASALFIFGAIIASFSTQMIIMIISRIILGFAVGIASSIVPVLISELAPANLRGRLVSLNQLMIVTGIMLAYLANYALHGLSNDWRWMIGLAVVPSLLFGIGVLSLDESPRWLTLHGKLDEARAVLTKFREPADVEPELAEITASEENSVAQEGWGALRNPALRRVLVAGVGLQVLGQLTGVNAVVYYAPYIFKSAGLGASSALLATVGIGIINLVGTLVGMSLVDKIGRTKLLAGATVFTFLSLATFAVLLIGGVPTGGASFVGVIAIFVYIASVAVGLDVVVFIIPSELYPLRVRGTAMSLTLGVNWTMSFIVSLTFLSIFNAFGGPVTFGIYAVVAALLVVFALKVIPETKDKSLEEIERQYVTERK